MGIEVHQGRFSSMAEVLDDIKIQGTWPTTFVSGPSAGLPVHWHDHDVHAYVLEGDTDFLDAESGDRLPVRQGDKVIVPARTLHAEGAVAERVVYVLAVPEPLTGERFLAMRDPSELEAGS